MINFFRFRIFFSCVAAAFFVGSSGCAARDGLFPLKTGESWTYTVKNSFATRVQQVRVARQIPVALTNGFELQGPMGLSRLAWRDGVLYAEALPNTRVYKPLPLLVGKGGTATMRWTGMVATAAGAQKAGAELSQTPDTVVIGAKKMEAVRCNLAIHMSGRIVELDTWYVEGIGPVKQDQRTNGNLDEHLEWLSGPS